MKQIVIFLWVLLLTLADCQRRNKKGDGVRMAPPTKPEISRLSEDSVMVRWDVPINDGLAINFFKIQFRELEQNRNSDRNPGPSWRTVDEDIAPHIHSYAVTGLKTGGSYKFRIVAVYSNNDNRVGPKSNKYVLLKDPPMKRPSNGPYIHAAEAISQSAILLRWTSVEQDSVPVEGFFIHYRDTSSAGEYYKATSLGANTRSHIITHLLPDTSYDIKMQCFNAAGTSNFSNIVSNKTWPTPEVSTSPSPPIVSPTVPSHGHGNFPKILTPISVSKFDQTVYLTIGITVVVLILVFIVIAILCCNRRKDNASTASTSSQNIVTGPKGSTASRKKMMKNERHPKHAKANSIHNLHAHTNGITVGGGNNLDLFDNHYKIHHTNGLSNGHHLAKSMNGLSSNGTSKSNGNGFMFRDVDEPVNDFDHLRMPLRGRQGYDTDEEDGGGGISMSYEARSRTIASSSFIAPGNRNFSQSTRDVNKKTSSSVHHPNSQHNLHLHNNHLINNGQLNTGTFNRNHPHSMNNNNIENNVVSNSNVDSSNNNPNVNSQQQQQQQHFAGISTIERRRKVYNNPDEVHPSLLSNSVKMSHRSTSFTRLNGTLERNKKKSRTDLVSTPGPESALEDDDQLSLSQQSESRFSQNRYSDNRSSNNFPMDMERGNHHPMMSMLGTSTWNGRIIGSIRNNHNQYAQHHNQQQQSTMSPMSNSSSSSGVSHNTFNSSYHGSHPISNNTNMNGHQPSNPSNGGGHFMMMQSSC